MAAYTNRCETTCSKCRHLECSVAKRSRCTTITKGDEHMATFSNHRSYLLHQSYFEHACWSNTRWPPTFRAHTRKSTQAIITKPAVIYLLALSLKQKKQAHDVHAASTQPQAGLAGDRNRRQKLAPYVENFCRDFRAACVLPCASSCLHRPAKV